MNIFDTSTLATDTHMTRDDFVNEIIPKVQFILASRFPNCPQKQKIRVHNNRISFAAPCCGDSATVYSKKRGNIILDGPFKNMYKCFNCGECLSLNNFFKKYGQNLSLPAIDYISKESPTIDVFKKADPSINYLYDTELINSLAIDREYFKRTFGLEECNIPNKAYYYLINRQQYGFDKFLYHSNAQILFILNLTDENKIFGMQIHHMKEGYKGPKYKTYSLKNIHDTFLHDNIEIPDEINSLSMIFNILNINYNKDITVLEGPMDSFLVPNSIALCGAGKHIKFPFKCRYLFDSDKTGKEHAIEYINNGYSVFLWDKYVSASGLPTKKKWDVNDAVTWAAKNRFKLPSFEPYFSNDPLDIIDL